MNTGRHAPDDEVRTLKRQVDRHLSEPHIFQCISEHHIDGIHNVQPLNDLPGWWGKLNLFSGAVSHSRNLWLDLDVTITNSIDALVAPLTGASHVRTALNWAASGHDGCQSSVMYWEGDAARHITESFNHKDAHWPPRTDLFWDNGQVIWGDQEYMTYLRDTGKLEVEYFATADVVSYKYHCRNGLPPHSRIQVFHGRPNPSDVNDDWARIARQ
jgi:hypothetical protein